MSTRQLPKLAVFLVGAMVASVLLPGLSGCAAGETPISRVMGVLQGRPALTDDAKREMARFYAVYGKYANNTTGTRFLKHFRDAFERVRSSYVRPITDKALIDEAIKGVEELNAKPGSVPSVEVVEAALDKMLASLDPHSAYLNPDELRETTVSTRGEFGGLGIRVTMDGDAVKVVSPIEDTPADRAGLKTGDLITHLDDTAVKGMNLMQAVSLMRGRPGSELRLTVVRDKQPPFQVTLIRAVIRVKAVRWRVEGDVGYIRVSQFSEKVEDGIEDATEAIRDKLGPLLKGYVLDLRSNPGGLLDQSLVLSDAFLDKGRIVSAKGRSKSSEKVYRARRGDLARGLPLVVLINGGSASASEIVAGALQDHRRAVIMGVPSFGKGSVQTISPLPIEGALRLTTALYYLPSVRLIQARGIVPDIRLSGDDKEKDEKGRKRESDLPGALPGSTTGDSRRDVSVALDTCEAVGPEKKDRALGCALGYLHSESVEAFVRDHASTVK